MIVFINLFVKIMSLECHQNDILEILYDTKYNTQRCANESSSDKDQQKRRGEVEHV